MATDIDYPASLPPPISTGYEINDMPAVARDDMDNGIPRQRLRDESLRTEFPIVFKFTKPQLALFEAWLRWKVGWTGWFNINLEGGVGLTSHEARFQLGNPPKAPRQIGGWYYVQAVLEVVDRPMLTEADYDLVVGEDLDALFAVIGDIDDFMHTNLWGT